MLHSCTSLPSLYYACMSPALSLQLLTLPGGQPPAVHRAAPEQWWYYAAPGVPVPPLVFCSHQRQQKTGSEVMSFLGVGSGKNLLSKSTPLTDF